MTKGAAQPTRIGRPVRRIDAPDKVAGRAPYAAESWRSRGLLHAALVGATVARGRIVDVDPSRALAQPGVLKVLTWRNCPPQAAWGTKLAPDSYATAVPICRTDEVRYRGEPIAIVVAKTPEAAREGARLVTANYQAVAPDCHLPPGNEPFEQVPADSRGRVNDFEAGYARAPVQLEAVYETPCQAHGQMEPHATVAFWRDNRLILHTSNQDVAFARDCVAATLQLPVAQVQVISRAIGGGFGGKLDVHADCMAAALASKAVGLPVRAVLSRQQVFEMTTHRPRSIQRVRLGAERDGRIVAMAHEARTADARFNEYNEGASGQTKGLYGPPNMLVHDQRVGLDVPRGGAMRAPGEAIGMLAIEAAMDELAERLDLDPIELRVLNEPTAYGKSKIPFSDRRLIECLREGAKRIGWARRASRPRSRVEGDRWIGLGVSSAYRFHYMPASDAVAFINGEGATIRAATTDIGTGSATILAQIAADTLGLAIEDVRVEIGDSDLPRAAGSGGSGAAGSVGSAVLDACSKLKADLLKRAGLSPDDPAAADLRALARRVAPNGLEMKGSIGDGDYETTSKNSYGAHFAEVAVDQVTGEVRVRRMVGVFSAGRILNPTTARSQLVGGIIMGLGAALMEENEVDPRYGGFVHRDLANYHLPVHADIPEIDVVMLDDVDPVANPLGAKGVGEVAISGVGAAIANAIYNACGARVRQYPIRLDRILLAADHEMGATGAKPS